MTNNQGMMSELEILERLARLEEAERFRKKHFGGEGYIPNPAQLRAHKKVAKTILYTGGNRAGKSTFGAQELYFHLTKKYPDYFPKERRFEGPVKCAISCTEFPIVTRVIEPKIVAVLPSGSYRMKKTAQGYVSRIEYEDGSTIDVLTLEMKNEAYESADWDFVWCDEPQSQTKYYAMRRGLIDRQGQMVITFTPLTEPWMHDELISKADEVRIAVVTADIRENLFDVSGNPILNADAVQEFEDSLPDDLKETRARGHFFHLRGRIYQEFGDCHQIDTKYEYPDPVIAVCDPHDRLPHHVIWAYVDRTDDVFVDYELEFRGELPDLARKILAVEKMKGYNVKKRIIDPNFGLKPSKPGVITTVKQELGVHGAYFYEGNDDVELGHMLVREALHYNTKKPVTAVNKPKLYFNKLVIKTIRSMKNLQYEEWKGVTRDERDPKEIPKQKETHGADCVRYLLASKPTYRSLTRSRESEPEGSAY